MSPDPSLAWPLPRPGALVQRRGPGVERRLARVESFDSIRLSERDRRIIELAHSRLGDKRVDFSEALRGLREAVRELIPAGRTYLLGTTEFGPIVGSIVSGVGIAASPEGILLVRVERD